MGVISPASRHRTVPDLGFLRSSFWTSLTPFLRHLSDALLVTSESSSASRLSSSSGLGMTDRWEGLQLASSKGTDLASEEEAAPEDLGFLLSFSGVAVVR